MPRSPSRPASTLLVDSLSDEVLMGDTAMDDTQQTSHGLPSSMSMSSFSTAQEYPSSPPDDVQINELARADTIKAGTDGKIRKNSSSHRRTIRADHGGSLNVDTSELLRNGSTSSAMNETAVVPLDPAPASTGGRYFSKRARRRSKEELRNEQSTFTTEWKSNERDQPLAPTASSPLSSMFPFFGRHKDTTQVVQRRTTSSPLPSSAPATRSPSPDPQGPALSRANTPRAASLTVIRPAPEISNGKRRLTYLQDVVAHQRSKTPPPQNDPSPPELPTEKIVPRVPTTSIDVDSGQMPSRPSDIVITPSSPSKPDSAAIFWSDGPHNTDEAMSTQLDRQRTVRASLSSRQSGDTLNVGANRPRLRHVRSLGLGKPTLNGEYSDTSTFGPSGPSVFHQPTESPYREREGYTRSASSILLQPQVHNSDRSRSPSPTGAGRSVSFTSPERPWRGRGFSEMNISVDDMPTRPHKVIRKARSFSGIFSSPLSTFQSSSSQVLLEDDRRAIAHESSRVSSREVEQSKQDPEKLSTAKTPSTSLLKGAMEWLGARKSSRNRKASDAQLSLQIPAIDTHKNQYSVSAAHPLDIPGNANRHAVSSHSKQTTMSPGGFLGSSKSWNHSQTTRRSTLMQPSSDTPSFSDSPVFSPRTSSLSPYPGDHSNSESDSSRNSSRLSPAPSVQTISVSTQYQEVTNSLPPIDAPSPLDALYFSSYNVPQPRFGSIARSSIADEPDVVLVAQPMDIRDSPPSPLSNNTELQSTPINVPQPLTNDEQSQRNRHARQRAHSDAPSRKSGSSTQPSSQPAAADRDISQLFGGGGGLGRRPTLGERSNSAGSAVLDRVKTAISGRNRSNSLLRTSTGEFSPMNSSRSFATSLSGSSTSLKSLFNGQMSRQASYDQSQQQLSEPPLSASAIFAQRSGARLTVPLSPSRPNTVLAEVGSPRPSISSSVTSSTRSYKDPSQIRRHSTQTTDKAESSPSPSSGPNGRARSSTVSVVSSSPSKQGAVSSLRKRPGAARRLSVGIFGSPTSSSKSTNLFPLPGRTAPGTTTALGNQSAMGVNGATASGQRTVPKPSRPVPQHYHDEEPAHWLKRLLDNLTPSEVASALASKSDQTYTKTLYLFMRNFDFRQDALDVALRKLLMVVALPRETQQIDRVVEAFAKRYVECQQGLFLDPDHAYVLAFSLMMLHTDAFNRNNKHKMAKADYVKNTRLDGIPTLVLEIFFDNICYTPFVYMEEEGIPIAFGVDKIAPGHPFGVASGTSAPIVLRNGKLDIYGMIASGTLHSLRVDLKSVIPPLDPFSWYGTRPFFNFAQVQAAFISAPTLTVMENKPRRRSGAVLVSTDAGMVPGAVGRSENRAGSVGSLNLRVVKVGLLSRKDDLLEGGKKATNRKWKSWSVILTSSQLIFLKDPTWALSLQDHFGVDEAGKQANFPRIAGFRPDEVFSLKLACGLFDVAYGKYANTFRLILAEGRQFLLQAPDEFEMNEWIEKINFVATFKTASLKIRPSTTTLLPDLSQAKLLAGDEHKQGPAPPDPFQNSLPTGVGSTETAWPSPARDHESKLVEFRRIAAPMAKTIEENLRIARNLAVLTSFQKGGRDRIETSLRPMGDRIRHSQLELARLQAWIGVLEADVAAGQHVDYTAGGTTANSIATTRSLPPSSTFGAEDDLGHAVESQLDDQGMSIRPASSVTLQKDGHRRVNDDWQQPAEMDRSSSASFHTAWEREIALPSPDVDATAASIPPEVETLQSPSTTESAAQENELEDWQNILDDKRRHLADVPVEGLRKLSLRMAKD